MKLHYKFGLLYKFELLTIIALLEENIESLKE